MDLPNYSYRLPNSHNFSQFPFPPKSIHENTHGFLCIHGENTKNLQWFYIKDDLNEEDGLGIHSHIGIFCLIITCQFLLRELVEHETSMALQASTGHIVNSSRTAQRNRNGKLAEQGSYVPKRYLTAPAHGRPKTKGGRRAGREDSPSEVPAAGGRCWWKGSGSHRGNRQAGAGERSTRRSGRLLQRARGRRVFEAEAALGVGGAVTVMWWRGRRLGTRKGRGIRRTAGRVGWKVAFVGPQVIRAYEGRFVDRAVHGL